MHPRRQSKFHMLPRTLKRHLVRRILGTKLTLRAPQWSRSPIKEGEIWQEEKTPAQVGSTFRRYSERSQNPGEEGAHFAWGLRRWPGHGFFVQHFKPRPRLFFEKCVWAFWPACMPVPLACLVPSEVRRRCQIPWNWSYRWLWTTKWVLGIEAGFPRRVAIALNHEVTSLAPKAKVSKTR